MRYTIDDKICKKYKLTLPELLILMVIKSGHSLKKTIEKMKNKGLFKDEVTDCPNITESTSLDIMETCDRILLESDKSVPSNDRLLNLAEELIKLFPSGKKEGTSQYWKSSKRDIALRLAKFFKLYGTYTDEQIIEATKNYVEAHNGRYQYMRVLKYFIWKDTRKEGPDGTFYIEESSDLAAFLENAGQAEFNDEWNVTLR